MCRPRTTTPPLEDRSIRSVLQRATALLRESLTGAPAGSADTPYLDALVLLGVATGESRERLLASLPDELTDDARERFDRLLDRRSTGEPVSYIVGKKEFYGREFDVSPAVLVPRPDTETLVDVALEFIDEIVRNEPSAAIHVHDTCTGSGCIAVTVAAERPHVDMTASDISRAALEIAMRNADRLGTRVRFEESDLLDWLAQACGRGEVAAPRIITANPPYLTDTEYGTMKSAGWPEPELALRGGDDGLEPFRRLVEQAVTVLPSRGYLICEIGPDQGASTVHILGDAGFTPMIKHDLEGRDRVVAGRR